MNDTAFPSASFDDDSIVTVWPGAGPSLGRIDQYDLIRKLGGGGFGVVYLARDSVSGVEVAIKTLHPLLKHSPEEMEALRAKFALVSRLAHPNVATALVLHPVRDVDVWDDDARRELKLSPGDSVMVMRYAPGVTLSKWRRQFPDGVVPPDLALEIGRQIASALDYAHSEKIVHRDVKPGNVMVETLAAGPQGVEGLNVESQKSEDGTGPWTFDLGPSTRIRVRLLDFGLAAEIRSSMSRISTEQGDTSGTRPYMAPEQWLGRKQDGRTDQYALACVLYELLSGAPPFSGVFETGDPMIMLAAVKGETPEEIDDLPPAANAALLRALSKAPKDRFPTCGAFVEALEGRDGSTSRPPDGRAVGASLPETAGGASPTGEPQRESGISGRALPPGAPRRSEEAARSASVPYQATAAANHRRRARFVSFLPRIGRALVAAVAIAVLGAGTLWFARSRGGAEPESHAELAETAEPGGEAGPLAEGAAERSDAGAVAALDLGSGVSLEMVHCPDIAPDFWMGKYEVTQEQWDRVMGTDPSSFKGAKNPVENVSWHDCTSFIARLNALPAARKSGLTFRLPSEEEWERACRTGSTGASCKLADGTEISASTLGRVAWFGGNSDSKTHPVGQKEPNAFGLYDMHGNVWEWTQTAGGGSRVLRGGSWFNSAWDCEFSSRLGCLPDTRDGRLGFRLCASGRADKAPAQPEAQARPSEGERAARSAAASRSEGGAVAALDLGSGVSLEMVHCPDIAPDFWMGKYEVTQEQWDRVMGTAPSSFKGAKNPVENVSWHDCTNFIARLNALPAARKSGLTFRLPSEEEWERACRAGSTGAYCKLADGTKISASTLGRVAWFSDNSEDKTHPVGQKEPNAWGLYDMHGNVWEWTGTAVGEYRVDRGGSWLGSAGRCESSPRSWGSPSSRYCNLGFRLCASGRAD